jgi:hypothetical protein
LHVVGEDAEVHAEVAGEERQRQEDRGDDGERVDDLGLPAPFRSAHLELYRREPVRREATVSCRLSVAAEPGE